LTNSQNAAKVNQDLFYASAAPPQETLEPEAQETKKKKKKKNKKKDLDAQSDLDTGSVINGAIEDTHEVEETTN
jgi:hypothetical protein